jgi:hypothetical protein
MSKNFFFSQINKNSDNGLIIFENLDVITDFNKFNNINDSNLKDTKFYNDISNNKQIIIKDIKNPRDKILLISFWLYNPNNNLKLTNHSLIKIDNLDILNIKDNEFYLVDTKINLLKKIAISNLYLINLEVKYINDYSINITLSINDDNKVNKTTNVQSSLNVLKIALNKEYYIGNINVNVILSSEYNNNNFFNNINNKYKNTLTNINIPTPSPIFNNQHLVKFIDNYSKNNNNILISSCIIYLDKDFENNNSFRSTTNIVPANRLFINKFYNELNMNLSRVLPNQNKIITIDKFKYELQFKNNTLDSTNYTIKNITNIVDILKNTDNIENADILIMINTSTLPLNNNSNILNIETASSSGKVAHIIWNFNSFKKIMFYMKDFFAENTDELNNLTEQEQIQIGTNAKQISLDNDNILIDISHDKNIYNKFTYEGTAYLSAEIHYNITNIQYESLNTDNIPSTTTTQPSTPLLLGNADIERQSRNTINTTTTKPLLFNFNNNNSIISQPPATTQPVTTTTTTQPSTIIEPPITTSELNLKLNVTPVNIDILNLSMKSRSTTIDQFTNINNPMSYSNVKTTYNVNKYNYDSTSASLFDKLFK